MMFSSTHVHRQRLCCLRVQKLCRERLRDLPSIHVQCNDVIVFTTCLFLPGIFFLAFFALIVEYEKWSIVFSLYHVCKSPDQFQRLQTGWTERLFYITFFLLCCNVDCIILVKYILNKKVKKSSVVTKLFFQFRRTVQAQLLITELPSHLITGTAAENKRIVLFIVAFILFWHSFSSFHINPSFDFS